MGQLGREKCNLHSDKATERKGNVEGFFCLVQSSLAVATSFNLNQI